MASAGVASVPHIRALTRRKFIHRPGRREMNWLHTTQRWSGNVLWRSHTRASPEGIRHAAVEALCWADAQLSHFQDHGRSRRHGSRRPCLGRLRFDAARARSSPLVVRTTDCIYHALHRAWRQPRSSGAHSAKGAQLPGPARSTRCSACTGAGGDDLGGGHRHPRGSAQRDGCAVIAYARA